MNQRKVSVILAGYNEHDNIEKAMIQTYSALEENFEDFELLLIDDASKDDTLDRMIAYAQNKSNVKVFPNYINLNFGTSVLRGILAATGDIIIFNACDLPLSVDDMVTILKGFDEQTDLLVLQRTDYKTTKWRSITSDINRLLLKILYPRLTKGTPIMNYVQVFNRRCIKDIIPLARSPIFVWPEMIFRAKIKGLCVKNIAVKCNVEHIRKGAFGHPHDIIWGIYDMLRFKIKVWSRCV